MRVCFPFVFSTGHGDDDHGIYYLYTCNDFYVRHIILHP